nr:reverse transcriptase domain-containing protein [Tanacetum cinerariifolium]
MQTRSSLKLSRDQTSNPTSSTNPTPKGRIRRSSKQKVENSHFEENLTPVATMTDNRTMAEMLRAPIEGCAEAIIIPPILAEQFELKHSLINMMTSKQFFGLEKDNPHDHVRCEDCLKDLVSHKQSGNPTFSLHKEIASPKVIHEFHDSKGCTFLSEELPDTGSFNDIHPYFDDDPLSGSTTYSTNSLLEEFAGELALITYPLDYDDNLECDIEYDIREIEFLLFQEMFTDEQPPDYSFPPRFDVYPDDILEIESDATFDDDSFDSEGEKIKEAELLIDQLDLPCDILSEYDSFNSRDFSRDDVLPSPDNEDKVFNPGILSHEKSVKIITRVTKEKKLAVSFDSWLFEDFDPLFCELLVFKEVPNSMRLLPFSSENEEKVFKPGIYTSNKFYCFLPELSHLGFPVFKVNLIFLSLMKIFHVQSGKNTPPLDVLLFHFYPP